MDMQARWSVIRLRRAYWRNQQGAAAAEFALILVLLIVPLLNAIDLGIYVYDRMELDNAGQSAVQTAWAQCAATGMVPATVGTNCPGLAAALTGAAHSSSLGSDVSVAATAEKYCCPGAGALSCQGPVATTTPSNCTSGEAPGDYLFITVSYTYAPLYAAVSVASRLTTPITRIAYMRLS